MRTYAPADTTAVLDGLLDEPSLARGVVHHAVLPPRDAAFARLPGLAGSADRGRAGGARHRAAVHPPGGGDRGGPRRPGRRRRHADRVGQDRCATRCRSCRPSPRTRRRAPCSSSRPRRSARTRSPSSASSRAAAGLHVSASTYDGDTPAPIRSAIRSAGQVVATNPDMLHSAILPHHTKWFQLFEQLRYIVIDELHTYRGVFGGHVANVLRRLLRICAHYGSHPVIVCCSATIGNPGELAEALIGRPVDGHRPERRAGRRAPRPARRPAAARSGERRARLGRDPRPALGPAVPAGRPPDHRVRAIAGRRRAAADRPARVAARELRAADRASAATAAATCPPSGAPSSAACATARSSASSPPTRSSSASTSAGSTSRSWPAIRARSPAPGSSSGAPAGGQGTSVAILVASGAPVDQYVVHHPEFLLEGTPEEARADPDNLHVLLAHLRAATFELPFEPGEVFGPGPVDDLLAFLAEEGHVRQAGDGRWYWSSENFPASEISLRTAAPENVVIIDTTPDRPRVLGEVDLFSAQVLVHEHAIYIHESVQYHVDKLEWGERKAYVHKIDVDHYTYANRAVTLKPLEVFAEAPATGGRRVHGEVMVASLVTLYKKLKFLTDENVGWGPVDLPELELQTTAYWLTAEGLAGRWRRDELDVALPGAGRAIQTVASVLLMVDPRDLGLVSQIRSPHHEAPTIYLYEAVPGGVGLSERLWERHDELLAGAADLIAGCALRGGLPGLHGSAARAPRRRQGARPAPARRPRAHRRRVAAVAAPHRRRSPG